MKKTICLILAGLVTLAMLAAPVSSSPALTSMTVSSYLLKVGTGVTGTCTFSDSDPLTAHTINWDWGDDTVSSVAASAGLTSATATHVYAAPGVYLIDVCVVDANGEEDRWFAPQEVIVYDPAGGFATGGGWFDNAQGPMFSPMMSTEAATDGTNSKVIFAFVCNYRKGSILPVGNVEIHAEGMNFHSESYDWMVVNGNRAQFKGTGTIDGQAGYSFLITVIDGATAGAGDDLIRIKIWDSEHGWTIFDNEPWSSDYVDPYTVANGGSIIVHSR